VHADVPVPVDDGQPAGEIDPGGLGRHARRGEQVDEDLPVRRLHMAFLVELTSRRDRIWLPRHVEQSGWYLQQPVPDRMPILRDEQHSLVVVQCDDAYRPGVHDDVTDELDPVCR
jgi:hypothetical protein